MAVSAGDIVFNITGDASELNNAVSIATKRAGAKLGELGRMAGVAMTAAGAAITGALGLAVKSAVDFQAGLSKIATLGVTDLKSIETAIDDVAVKFGVDMTDGINAAYDALSSGVTQAQLPNVLAKAAMAAAAGVTDLNTAIKLGTSVTNAFGGSMDNMGTIFDQAFIAAKVGVTTFEELAASVGEVAPTMAAAKLTTDEMFASVAALTLAGLSTSKAANSMNAALSNIIKPTSEASKLAQKLGLDFSVTALSAKGLAGFLDSVKTATGGDVVMMGQLFGSTEALAAMLALTGNQAKAFNDTLVMMKGNTGATQEAFTAFAASNPSLAWQQLSGSIAVLSKNVGYALLPALYSLMEIITPIVTRMAEWAKANPDTVASIALLVTAIGGLMVAIGPLLIALPGIVAAIEAVSVVLGALGAALGISALAAAGWVAAIVAAVAAAIAGIWYFWDELVAAAQWGADSISRILAPIIDMMGWIGGWLGANMMGAGGMAAGMAADYITGGAVSMVPQTPEIATGGQGFGGGGITNSNTANVNFNMGGVSLSGDQDARRLSKTLANQMRTELRGLGYAT